MEPLAYTILAGLAAAQAAQLTAGKFTVTQQLLQPLRGWIEGWRYEEAHWSRTVGAVIAVWGSVAAVALTGQFTWPQTVSVVAMAWVGWKWLELFECTPCQAFHYVWWPTILFSGQPWWLAFAGWGVACLSLTAQTGRRPGVGSD